MDNIVAFLTENWKTILLICTSVWTIIQEIRQHFPKR